MSTLSALEVDRKASLPMKGSPGMMATMDVRG